MAGGLVQANRGDFPQPVRLRRPIISTQKGQLLPEGSTMKTIDDLYLEQLMRGRFGVHEHTAHQIFMAGAAAMATLLQGAMPAAPQEQAVWPPPPPPAPPPKCVHGRLFSEECELCEKSGNSTTRIVPLQSSEALVPDGT